ncbi:dynamin-related protein 4C-like [Rhododendron vialii]|uniref:dynamin-related protein 4C-like n=1 Tax=Rhododendron vialii TaxID=182163 RepID=UPI00265DD08C|nr:dynamin-related protein 4C-like [Rhododendron vialii]
MGSRYSTTAQQQLQNAHVEDEEGNPRLSIMAEDGEETSLPISAHPPLMFSFNERIRPLLDVVDKLRHLKVAQEGIQLPTIVVVGDQSSGKSSVLESLAGISLPRGQGICTRVPLIMRLQHHQNPQPELHLEYHGKIVPTGETHVAEAIVLATDEIAGNEKGISNVPLTLVVKKKGVPDLTMVDLPGITRVPVHGQPEDIYEQISEIIMEYIKPEESIILNVLSATVDFPTCESIRMSQRVDKSGERTLAVVTKADKAPEGLLEKVTADDVNIGLGYVCVRNRIGEESYEEAREEEAHLFQSHPLLSKIDKSIVGVPVLAQKLVHIQATIISKCLPEIVRKINDKLNSSMSELNKMPQHLSSVSEAMTVFMRIIGFSKESLRKILMRGEFDEYPEDRKMHCTARLVEMLNQYAGELQKSAENKLTENFLMDEMRVLDEVKGIGLPNFLPRTAFLVILQKKVKEISKTPVDFMAKVWDYIETVLITVFMNHCKNYPQLQSAMRRATHNLVAKIKDESLDRVMEIVEMENLADYTCSPEYMSDWGKLMAQQNLFMEVMNDHSKPTRIMVEGFGEIEVGHLCGHSDVLEQAFDMKMRITAYWKVVLKRLVDSMALHLLLRIRNLVDHDIEAEIVNELMGSPVGGPGAIQRMLEESPSAAKKRERLNRSIKLLKDSKEVVAHIIDRITVVD